MLGHVAVRGAIAGMDAAAAMSILRLAARRAGWIEEAAPHAVEQWAVQRTGAPPGPAAPDQRVLGELLHLGVGFVAGAAYGALTRPARTPAMAGGLAFGLAVWALSFGLLNPLLGIARPPWRARPVENVLNILSHLLFGGVTTLIAGELGRSPAPGLEPTRRLRRVG